MRFITRRNRTIVIFFNLLFIAGCHGSDPLQVVQPHNFGIVDADITKGLPHDKPDDPTEKPNVNDNSYQNNGPSSGGSTQAAAKLITLPVVDGPIGNERTYVADSHYKNNGPSSGGSTQAGSRSTTFN
ncbi:hypothetical protein, partial [uncultured Oceanicoccus sp.]|uniref:hypothetical protein n=1 Tax=uncultured Oceanicoccus sp. TaxID=1706381 RepID=UPI0030DCC684